MIRIISGIALLLVWTGSTFAAGKTITYYADGAIVQQEAMATRGIAEIPLPGDIMDGTLRITPLNGAVIKKVERLPTKKTDKGDKEPELLREQKSRLEDRLRALATREEIFKAAAKSQSGKAPRKTKANPDPMQSIRQGTDFAIAQLEAVYTAQRRTEQEISRIDKRIAATRHSKNEPATVARITIAPANGRVMASYVPDGSESWTPRYDLRLDDGKAALALYAHLPRSFGDALLRISPMRLSENSSAKTFPATNSATTLLANYLLPVSELKSSEGVRPFFSCILANHEQTHLPAGMAAVYIKGEYRGEIRFAGISSGRSRKIVSGS